MSYYVHDSSFSEYSDISNVFYSCTPKFQVNKYEVYKEMAGLEGGDILQLFCTLGTSEKGIVSEKDAYKVYQESVSGGV